jgi:hypothetical protein
MSPLLHHGFSVNAWPVLLIPVLLIGIYFVVLRAVIWRAFGVDEILSKPEDCSGRQGRCG